MAWVTPITWTQGQLVAATNLNEQIRDNMLHLKLAVNDSGKIPAISTTYFASVDGSNLTGVMRTAASNDFTAGTQDFSAGSGTRLVIPVGGNKWATT